jgi:hypothetical protein
MKITQIIQAQPGYYAVFGTGEARPVTCPIVVWALVELEGKEAETRTGPRKDRPHPAGISNARTEQGRAQSVVGLIFSQGKFEDAESWNSFNGYLYKPNKTEGADPEEVKTHPF